MSCLALKITLGERARMTASLLSAPMIAHVQLGNPPLRISTRIVCEDDRDIVSMLFNELTIDNNTLLINGDTPSLILKMLHNGQMLTNKHYLKN